MADTGGGRVPDAGGDDILASLLALITALAEELNRQAGMHLPAPDSDIDRDLGLDSLARVELAARIEAHFGVVLDETTAFAARTPAELADLIARAGGAGDRAGGAAAGMARQAAAGEAATGTRGAALGASTLVEALRWQVDADPHGVHVRLHADDGEGETLTHAELWNEARAVAAGLAGRGLVPGEMVALMLPTGRAYFVAFFGVILAGATPVPIYPPARRAQLEDHLRRQGAILRNAAVAMLLTVDEATLVGRLLSAACPSVRLVTTVAELGTAGGGETARPRRDDIAFLQYTSGSTGDPKGVVLTHANIIANVRADGLGLAVQPDDVFVSWLPLYHDMGLIGAWLGSLYHGVPLVIMSPLSFLARPQRWLWALHRFGGTLSAAPNFAYDLCVRRIRDDDIEGLDLSRWRLTLNGAEAVSAHTIAQFTERFAPYGFRAETMLPVYGLAECAVGLAFSPLGRAPRVDRIDRQALASTGRARAAGPHTADALEVVTCGVPLPAHEIRTVDPAGRELPDRVQGAVQFRGPSATRGYYRNEAATRELIRDGWLGTGDLGYLADGELFITGRTKDLVIRAGRNIHPAELEGGISALDGVRGGRVAAFGTPDPGGGTERLVVVVETRWRKAEDVDELRTRINSLGTRLVGAPPDDIVFAPPGTILRTSSGKVRRGACRDLYLGGRIGAGTPRPWLQLVRLALAGIGPQVRRLLGVTRTYLWAGYAWVSFGVFALAAFLAVVSPLPARQRWRTARRLARALARVVGLDIEVRSPRPARAAVYVCNHQSYLDGFVVTAAMPEPVTFLVKADLVDVAPVRLLLERLGARFVRRLDTQAALEDLEHAMRGDTAAAPLFVFPEGTFKRMPGVLPFRLGAFVAAAERDAALVPVAIRGSRSVLRSGSWLPRRGRIVVSVGEPLTAGEGTRWQRAVRLRDAARAFIVEHCGEPDLAHESNRLE